MWRTPPDVTEVSARFAKIFDPGQQRCVGVWINIQKFEAHSHVRFHYTDRCEHLCFLAFARKRCADAGAGLKGPARTHKTPSTRKILSHPPHSRPPFPFHLL